MVGYGKGTLGISLLNYKEKRSVLRQIVKLFRRILLARNGVNYDFEYIQWEKFLELVTVCG